jgi:inhibitor of KinA sporulation pathway (predicted exonuclease)
VRESDIFDEQTMKIVEDYVRFMAPKARCILKEKCQSICETCQRDHDARNRGQLKQSIGIAVKTLEAWAPHLLRGRRKD